MSSSTTHAIMVDESDEHLHPGSDHPHWNESAWFGATIPERTATLYVYFYHRPNMALSAGGIKIWDPSGSTEYDCLGYDYNRTQRLPDGVDMFDFALDNGLSVEMVEPFTHFRITHRGALQADLEWRAATSPSAFGQNAGLDGWTSTADGLTTGHYQQMGRLTGTVTVDGDTIPIDTGSIRDRSWGPRDASAARRMELLWCCASAENHFAVVTVSAEPPDDDPVLGTTDPVAFGYYTRDGVRGLVTGGSSRVHERGSDLRSRHVTLTAHDDQGRTLEAEGRGVNALVWPVYDRTYQVSAGTRWTFDGISYQGEDWTCMPTEQARRLLRAR